MYRITKRYGHEEGLSCAFRQWRAGETHCRFIHGYPLAFEFSFEGETLDDRNWLISFGELKELKQELKDSFDHKTCIALDDPALATFIALDEAGLIQLNVVEDVGCEKFAELAYKKAIKILGNKIRKGVRLVSVQVSEHGGNSATYMPSPEPKAEQKVVATLPKYAKPKDALQKYLDDLEYQRQKRPRARPSDQYIWTQRVVVGKDEAYIKSAKDPYNFLTQGTQF
jgi:6-pyruvoyltetrahydropterin/6-carboxytetrahydropterin synthase